MACAAGEDAVQKVLSKPDLVARILERLPVPELCFFPPSRWNWARVRNKERWVASHVGTVFRRAALRVPWEACWMMHTDSDSAPSLKALAFLESRRVQAWTVRLSAVYAESDEQALPSSTAVLHHARGTKKLTVESFSNASLLQWLHLTLTPLPEAQGSSGQGTPVLARLASLSRLTSLRVRCGMHWTDASWLTMITQLKYLDLDGYSGPPVSGLPALESLRVAQTHSTVPLEQWASPRLTQLSIDSSCLTIDVASGSSSAHCPSTSGSRDARVWAWLSRLQRLELKWRDPSIHTTGLRELLPALTYLSLCCTAQVLEDMTPLLAMGLPEDLKTLCLDGRNVLWSAVFGLQELVLLDVWQGKDFTLEEMATVVAGLIHLPELKRATLRLSVSDDFKARVGEGFKALNALLLDRHGYLNLDLDVESDSDDYPY